MLVCRRLWASCCWWRCCSPCQRQCLPRAGLNKVLVLHLDQIPTPQPPIISDPTDPIVTQSSKLESITVEIDGKKIQMLVPVTSVESVQHVEVPSNLGSEMKAPDALVNGVTVTMWRGMNWYANGNPNDPNVLWTVWSLARTSTDQCVDKVNAYAEHQYMQGGYWISYSPGGSSYSSDPCHNDSGMAQSGRGNYIAGTTHRSRGMHVAYINGTRYQWDDLGPGPLTVP